VQQHLPASLLGCFFQYNGWLGLHPGGNVPVFDPVYSIKHVILPVLIKLLGLEIYA
jgi:hypothetical protein